MPSALACASCGASSSRACAAAILAPSWASSSRSRRTSSSRAAAARAAPCVACGRRARRHRATPPPASASSGCALLQTASSAACSRPCASASARPGVARRAGDRWAPLGLGPRAAILATRSRRTLELRRRFIALAASGSRYQLCARPAHPQSSPSWRASASACRAVRVGGLLGRRPRPTSPSAASRAAARAAALARLESSPTCASSSSSEVPHRAALPEARASSETRASSVCRARAIDGGSRRGLRHDGLATRHAARGGGWCWGCRSLQPLPTARIDVTPSPRAQASAAARDLLVAHSLTGIVGLSVIRS